MAIAIHVHVTEAQRAFLLNESARSGLPMATYPLARRQHVRGFELNVGLWRRLDAAVTGRRLQKLD